MGNHQRSLRLRSGLKLDELTAIAREIRPNIDKAMLSKCENPEKYGVTLDYETKRHIFQTADPEGWEKYKRHTDGHRLRKSIRIRMSEETFDRLQKLMEEDGYVSFQEWGTVQIFRYISDHPGR